MFTKCGTDKKAFKYKMVKYKPRVIKRSASDKKINFFQSILRARTWCVPRPELHPAFSGKKIR